MTYHGILADMEALEDAVESLPTECLYHGDKLEVPFTGGVSHETWDDLPRLRVTDACCQSGKPALYRRRAEAALQRLRENL